VYRCCATSGVGVSVMFKLVMVNVDGLLPIYIAYTINATNPATKHNNRMYANCKPNGADGWSVLGLVTDMDSSCMI
jgi:hypothetical protein